MGTTAESMSRRRRGNQRNRTDQPAPVRADSLQVQIQRSAWQGPVPPPDVLRQYDEAAPGAANRILKMAENQSGHRIRLEGVVVNGDSRRAYLGLSAGFLVALTVIGCGTFLIYTGHDWAGASLVGLDLASFVGVFVYGTKVRRDERRQKSVTPDG